MESKSQRKNNKEMIDAMVFDVIVLKNSVAIFNGVKDIFLFLFCFLTVK